MILQADARHIPLADGSVQCVVTSPPYWGLRRYDGLPDSVWGGEEGCRHEWGPESMRHRGGLQGQTGQRADRDTSAQDAVADIKSGQFCRLCGAWRGQLGLEPSIALYIEHMLAVMAEVWRVLREDGTAWLNIGDSYANDGKWGGSTGGKHVSALHNFPGRSLFGPSNEVEKNEPSWLGIGRNKHVTGLKPKDLCLIPERLAIALQDAGWYVRSRIAWCKRAPMPESVTDRPTSAWEHIWLLSKNERYFYDADAVKEAITESSLQRISQPTFANQAGGSKDYRNGVNVSRLMRRTLENFAANAGNGRNMRNFWLLGPEPFPEAHFATFPTEIPRRAILAGSRPGDLVLDPFLGSGTTGAVAESLGRLWIGLEMSPEYVAIARRRTAQRGLALGAAAE